MQELVIDIETIPTSDPAVIAEIVERHNSRRNRQIAALSEKYAKESTIEKHARLLQESYDADLVEEIRDTALDGTFGQVVCVGLKFDNNPTVAFYQYEEATEDRVLKSVVDHIGDNYNQTPYLFIGHNVEWDLRFLWQRCIVNGVNANWFDINQIGRPYDTAAAWAGRYAPKKPKLETLCKALGVPTSKAKMSGKDVASAWMAGRVSDIVQYCIGDVEATHACYVKMRQC